VRLVLQLTHLPPAPTLHLRVDGADVDVPDDGSTLLEVLRDLGRRAAKDGCSPQGQCGCCTVWVDGAARVACVTPARRVAGREITTLDGLEATCRDRWVAAFVDTGASQCGFCTPGIIMRLAALAERRPAFDDGDVDRALAAHLCRCTGWVTIRAAAARWRAATLQTTGPGTGRDLDAAARRAALESGGPQAVGPEVVRGRGGFAEDTAPPDALVAVPDGLGGWVVADSLRAARDKAGTVPGRNSTAALVHPLAPPPGDWVLRLQTTFVEPAYLEPDASWCTPGRAPASPLANGGAFGGKADSAVLEVARRLADEHGRPVRVVLSRGDVVRLGPKRPPIAAGVRPDGTGVVRVARTPGARGLDGWSAALAAAAPGLEVEEVAVPGPPVSAALRGAGWAEGAVLMAVLDHVGRDVPATGTPVTGTPVTVRSPVGAQAEAVLAPDGSLRVTVQAGDVLDEVVLRSYALGAAHQALGWVRSEGVAVDPSGTVLDLTIRSFGIVPARDMPSVEVVVRDGPGPAVACGEAVLAAVAGAVWLADGLGPRWPTSRGGT